MPSTQQPQCPVSSPALNELAITVVHDNYPCADSLKTAWGFSAVVTRADADKSSSIRGSDGRTPAGEHARLRMEPSKRRHCSPLPRPRRPHGGLTGFLKARAHVEVYLPQSFPARVKDVVRGYGATIAEVAGPREICANVYTTGVMGRRIKEQALVLLYAAGACRTHRLCPPGIAKIVAEVKELHRKTFSL